MSKNPGHKRVTTKPSSPAKSRKSDKAFRLRSLAKPDMARNAGGAGDRPVRARALLQRRCANNAANQAIPYCVFVFRGVLTLRCALYMSNQTCIGAGLTQTGAYWWFGLAGSITQTSKSILVAQPVWGTFVTTMLPPPNRPGRRLKRPQQP